MAAQAYILWTDRGLSCRLDRQPEGWRVSIEADGGAPFLRREARSKGDAINQAEYLRLLLDRSRTGVRVAAARQRLVLIVEDDPENLYAYEEILNADGFRTASTRSVADARRLLGEVKPSAVLLDHVLRDGAGPALARELRATCDDAMPIVLVTGMDPSDVAAEYAGAADALLGKPCRPETLTGVLKLVVQRTVARDDLPAVSAPNAPSR